MHHNSRGYKDFLSDIANALLCLTIGVRCETTMINTYTDDLVLQFK